MASLLPSSLLLFSLRAALFCASRRFLTNSLNAISLAGVSSPADGLAVVNESGKVSPLIPLSRRASSQALALLGLGQDADALDQRRSRKGVDDGERRLHGSNASQVIFPLLFSESILLYLLVLFQSLEILSPRTRQLHWQLSLWALVGLLVVAVPGVGGWVLMRGSRKRGATTRLALASIPFLAMQLVFYSLPVPAQMLRSSSSGWLDPSLARLGVIGVLVLGALSGVGSINTALLFYSRSASSSWEEVTPEDLLLAERSLRSIARDIADRELEKDRRASVASADGRSGGWFGKVLSSVKGGDTSLDQELKGLHLLRDEVSRNLRGMMLRKERMRFSKTLKGRVWNFAGYLFAAYCILRLLLTIPSLISPASSLSGAPATANDEQPAQTQGDWLSYLLALGLSHLPFDVDVALWSRLISLGLAGLIVASSVEYVLGWVRRVLGKVGGGRKGVAELGVLVLGQLMALYLLSLLIQLRNSLPPSAIPSPLTTTPTSPLDPAPEPQLLASLPPFKAFNRLFDLAYVFGAVVTVITSWASGFVGGDGQVSDGGVEIWRGDDNA